VGIIIGAPTSFGFHSLKAGTRVASSATTFGCANPFISILEDIVAFVLALFAIFAPITVPILLLLIAWALWSVVKRIRARGAATSASAS
jgi:hypothetical protein